MSIILQKGVDVLRKTAKPIPVEQIKSREIQELLRDMSDTLRAEPDGVALAAPQIGQSLRLFIVLGRLFGEQAPEQVFINPELLSVSGGKISMHEGCLSVRTLYGNVERHREAVVRAYDENGKQFTLTGKDLIAQIFQHEIDHLNGILFTDTATDLEEIQPEKHNEETGN